MPTKVPIGRDFMVADRKLNVKITNTIPEQLPNECYAAWEAILCRILCANCFSLPNLPREYAALLN